MDFEFYFNDKCSEQENDIKWFMILKNALELGRREEKCQQRTNSETMTLMDLRDEGSLGPG